MPKLLEPVQLSLEDAAAGEAAKQEGLKILEQHNGNFLEACRTVAVLLIRRYEKTTAETVIAYIGGIPKELDEKHLPGAIFNDRRFISVGRVRSTHKAAHRREVKEWALRDAA